jgi:hypothetical protein
VTFKSYLLFPNFDIEEYHDEISSENGTDHFRAYESTIFDCKMPLNGAKETITVYLILQSALLLQNGVRLFINHCLTEISEVSECDDEIPWIGRNSS